MSAAHALFYFAATAFVTGFLAGIIVAGLFIRK